LLAVLTACLGFVLIVAGYPAPHWVPKAFGTKSLRKVFQLFFILSFAGVLIHPKRREWCDRFFSSLTEASRGEGGILVLVGIYSLLFLWNQLTAYFSADIHFLPFSFYDYMLHYVWLGKVNYTGLLHGFYHANNLLYFLAPLWYLFKTPLLLVILHGPLLALGAFPLFLLTRRIFPESWVPLSVSFFYLNFRYLLNLLAMDFLVESFYPLLIFFCAYFVISGRRTAFWVSVLFVLLIKEDAPFYMLGFGLFLLFVRERRSYGLGAILLSLLYAVFLTKVFLPWTGSHILTASAKNFSQTGGSPGEILKYHLTHPGVYFKHLFWSHEKLKTILKLLQSTFFIPLFSPWCLLVLTALLPPFARGDVSFVDLRFHYSAIVTPFLLIAFVMGLRSLGRLLDRTGFREVFFRVFFLALIGVTGGNYATNSLRSFQLETIRQASQIPQEAIVLSQGHLLPYLGYRTYNLYFAEPFERTRNPYHEIYDNADYYFLARSVNPYPYDRAWVEKKIARLKGDPRLELLYDDGERVLLKRKGEPYPVPPGNIPVSFDFTQHPEETVS